jgi:Zn-dependent M16 (insulinase) family peptidase
MMVRMRSLERSADEALELLGRLLRELDFADTGRLRQIVDELREEMLSALIPNGHYFAGLRSGAAAHGLIQLEENMNGVTQVRHLEQFSAELNGEDGGAETLAAELRDLCTDLLDPRRLSVNVTGADAAISGVTQWLPQLHELLARRRVATDARAAEVGTASTAEDDRSGIIPAAASDRPQTEFLLGSSTVSYVAQTFRGLRYGDDLDAAQDLLAHILRTGLLWEKIRMKGGAYGAFAASRTTEGLFSFASYRDPHSARTLEAYREALEELVRDQLPESAVELAKVSMLGRELRPLTPRDAGFVDFRRRLYDINDQMRQAMRDRLRAVRPEDIRQVARTLVDTIADGHVAVLGGRAGLDELRTASSTAAVSVYELGI